MDINAFRKVAKFRFEGDGRWWCLIDDMRFCYVIGGNRTYMAERSTRSSIYPNKASFGPAKTKLEAAWLAYRDSHTK